MQSKQSKFKANENFSRFPSFQLFSWGQIVNSETSEIFIFSLLSHIIKLYFFVSGLFLVFGSWFPYTTYLGCRVKSKTRKPQKFLFFLIKLYLKVTFFVWSHFSGFWILSFSYYQKLKEMKTFRYFQIFDFRYRPQSKTWKPWKFYFFLYFLRFCFLLFFILSFCW